MFKTETVYKNIMKRYAIYFLDLALIKNDKKYYGKELDINLMFLKMEYLS